MAWTQSEYAHGVPDARTWGSCRCIRGGCNENGFVLVLGYVVSLPLVIKRCELQLSFDRAGLSTLRSPLRHVPTSIGCIRSPLRSGYLDIEHVIRSRMVSDGQWCNDCVSGMSCRVVFVSSREQSAM